MCWVLLADALQQYTGMDFDNSAALAAELWRDGDKEYVHAGTWVDEHSPAAGTPDAIVAALAAMDFPADNFGFGGCALCHEEPTHGVHIDEEGRRAGCIIPEEQQHKPDCPWRQARDWQQKGTLPC